MVQRLEKITTVRFTALQLNRLRLLACEKQWSISKMVQFIIDVYCNSLFEENSLMFKGERK